MTKTPKDQAPLFYKKVVLGLLSIHACLLYMYNLPCNCFVVEVCFSFCAKGYRTGFEGKKRVVFADTDIFTREHICSALAHDNGPGLCRSAVRDFNSEILRI